MGRDDKNFTDQWYDAIAKSEAELNCLTVRHSEQLMTSYDVSIATARRTLVRCLTTDEEVTEVNRAISAVTNKVTTRERLNRSERFHEDGILNRARVRKRLGLPPQLSDKSFLKGGNPKQGGSRHRSRSRGRPQQRPTTRENNRNNRDNRDGQPNNNRGRDNRQPRSRSQTGRNNGRTQEDKISFLLRELKKLQRNN